MSKTVALLRGINVGGHNKLPMRALKALLESNGYENVQTYIQSGNVVFDHSESLGSDIAELILAEFGFMPDVMLLSADAFCRALKNNPYPDFEGKFVHFYFCKTIPEPDWEKAKQLASESERYELIGQVFYIHTPDGIARSKLVAGVEKCLEVSATGRNLNTVNKIMAILEK